MRKALSFGFAVFLISLAAFSAFGQAPSHLIITEFVISPTAGEFVEIYNPTSETINLSNYYLTDATFAGGGTYYYNIVTGANAGGGTFGDFNARFPEGATIAPGEHQTIAMVGNGFFNTYGVQPTYELFEDGPAADDIPDMREATPGSIANQGGLTNDGEVLVLYYWDGASDLVQDVDYVVWGDKAEAVDKTGVSIDGPDADSTPSSYLPDTPIAQQFVVNTENDADPNPHNDGSSAQRKLNVEDLENWTGGNGITGHNETSENTSWMGGIWSINAPATPGARALGDSLNIADIQFVRADAIGATNADDSPFVGDTITVTGIMMQGAREIFVGARWGGFVQDERGGPWSGFFVIQNDSNVAGTLFSSAQAGDKIKITGVLSEFPTSAGSQSITQLALLTNPVTQVDFLDFGLPLPEPILLKPGDLGASAGTTNTQLAERWESTLVRFENLTVTANGLAGNIMTAADATGSISLDDYFDAVFDVVSANGGVWPGFPAGTRINVTGFIRGGTTQGTTTINPRSLADIEVASSPPVITNIARNPVVATSTAAVTVSANIVDTQTSVASAELNYRINGGAFQTQTMTAGGANQFSGNIPAQADGAFVEYFLAAADTDGDRTTIPADTSVSKFFYFVRDAGLKVFDLQYTPFADGNSGYTNLTVTVQGIVTTDTTDFSFYWIQDGNDPWSGIWVNDNTTNVKAGDLVSVTGRVEENFEVTRITAPSNVTILSRGNPVPAPVQVRTGDLRTGAATAEQWESVLVQVRNAVVSNPFPDGASNFGEFSIDDGSGEVRVDDLGDFDGNLDSNYVQGDSIRSLIGVHYYSFNNYKLLPRNNNDVVRAPTSVADRNEAPLTYALEQNYPNPFNPETTIKYQLPQGGKISLVIYNMLGQKVRTLVDAVKPAGVHSINWDGRNERGLAVPTGVYFYKMSSKSFEKVNKMLLIK